jgi:hypothetical protein
MTSPEGGLFHWADEFDSHLGTEPASESRIQSRCGSTQGIRFYCKPVTLVRCREIGGETRFSLVVEIL